MTQVISKVREISSDQPEVIDQDLAHQLIRDLVAVLSIATISQNDLQQVALRFHRLDGDISDTEARKFAANIAQMTGGTIACLYATFQRLLEMGAGSLISQSLNGQGDELIQKILGGQQVTKSTEGVSEN